MRLAIIITNKRTRTVMQITCTITAMYVVVYLFNKITMLPKYTSMQFMQAYYPIRLFLENNSWRSNGLYTSQD